MSTHDNADYGYDNAGNETTRRCIWCGKQVVLEPSWNGQIVQMGRRFYRKMVLVCPDCNSERWAPREDWPETDGPTDSGEAS